jgi:hypothetical protein
MITQQVRSNASLKSIEKAQKQLKENWDKAFDNAEILFYEGEYPIKDIPDTAYLIIGSQVRWGYNNGFSSWGFSKTHVDREIAGQKEFAYRQNI